MPVTRRALALALALALAACAAAALAPLARPGLPPWMEGVAAQADFGPAGYLMYVVVGNGTWAGARLQQGVAYSEYSQGLSWECAGKGEPLVGSARLGPGVVAEGCS